MAAFTRLLLKILALLPLRIVQGLGASIGALSTIIPNRRLQTTRVNIGLCYADVSMAMQKRLVRRSLMESAKGALESSALWLWNNERALDLVKHTSGEHLLESAFKNKKGVILALPHLGMWEIIGLYCSARYPMTSLYRPPPMAGMNSVMQSGRQRFGAALVPTDKSGVRALYRALERGELVAILPDQEPGKTGGIFAPFFKIQAHTMILLSRLASKTNATVLFVYAERLSKGQGYHIHFIPASEQINNANINVSISHLNAGIEQCVRELPEQYLWSYKRFRTRPKGEPDIYSE